MRKLVLSMMFLASLVEARFYLGLEAGGTYERYIDNQSLINDNNQGREGSVYGAYVGVNLGTEHYFARDSLLFRWFISGGGNVLVGYGDLNLGLDFMGTLYKSETSAFGIFLGLEMSTSFVNSDSDFGGHLRMGISTMQGDHHRFELYYRMLLGEITESRVYWVDTQPYGGRGYDYYRHYTRSDALIFAYKYVY